MLQHQTNRSSFNRHFIANQSSIYSNEADDAKCKTEALVNVNINLYSA